MPQPVTITLELTLAQAHGLMGWLEDDAEKSLQQHGRITHGCTSWLPRQISQVLVALYDKLGWPKAFKEEVRQKMREQSCGPTSYEEVLGVDTERLQADAYFEALVHYYRGESSEPRRDHYPELSVIAAQRICDLSWQFFEING